MTRPFKLNSIKIFALTLEKKFMKISKRMMEKINFCVYQVFR